MTYTAKTPEQLRKSGGSLAQKVSAELVLIDAAIDALGSGTGALANGSIFVGNGSNVATAVAMSGDVTCDNTGVTTIGAGKVTLANHVAASEDGTVCKVVAESNVIGGIPVIFMIPITAGANADVDITMTHKIRVLDAHVILRGAGVTSAVFTVKNGANAITSGMTASGSDTVLSRTTLIDDAYYELAATTGVLRVTGSGGATMPAALVVVTGVRVA